MKVVGIIPARYASTRLPGKPLADLCGKTLIKRVFDNAQQLGLDDVWVATDHEAIASEIGEKAIMTASHFPNGTHRVAHVARQVDADVVVNIQGDEPFIQKEPIQALINLFSSKKNTDIATLCHPLREPASLQNPAHVKVVLTKTQRALYFSRAPIPYVRDEADLSLWCNKHSFYKHIGIYAFRKDVLTQLVKLPESPLANAENLEQLNWMENGYNIEVAITQHESLSVDTQEDLAKAQYIFQQSIKA